MEKESIRHIIEIEHQPEHSSVSDAIDEMTEFLKGEFPGVGTPGEDVVLDEESSQDPNVLPVPDPKP